MFDVQNGKEGDFKLDENEILRCNDRVYVPSNEEVRKQLMEEAHKTPYSVQPGVTKMYQDLKKVYWWPGMKKDIAEFVQKCLTCQKLMQSIRNQLECCNHSRFHSGSGN